MPEFVPVENLKQMVGQENGLSDWGLIDQDRINRFAAHHRANYVGNPFG